MKSLLVVFIIAAVVATTMAWISPKCLMHGRDGETCEGRKKLKDKWGPFIRTYCCESKNLLAWVSREQEGTSKNIIKKCRCLPRRTVCAEDPSRCHLFSR
ncbi:hypothetical protein EGW08_007584 [Elysia chlorotica]|uniref:Uncharacterized protein n=1 Tax=Elysia chlorotica TaxID=188477 RepID=A0A433TSX5_ELYCH|nr:hypothetical protein EGW08_007584 [Elysia chlorotica]